MTHKREYKDYFNDIYDAINKIQKFTKDMSFKEFTSDDRTHKIKLDKLGHSSGLGCPDGCVLGS